MQSKVTSEIIAKSREIAKNFIEFNNQVVSPYQAAHKLEERLIKAGFQQLKETDVWKLENGKFYYLKRGFNSSLVAFGIPTNGFDTKSCGFKIIGGHMDSTCIRLAPRFEGKSCGYDQVFIQTYGGGIWHTWLDRDLVLGGRVVIKTEKGLETRLYHSKRPIAKIPNLAIHLTTNRDSFTLNKETELRPIIATELMKTFYQQDNNPSSVIRNLISTELGCKEEEIVDFDLCFGDSHNTATFGIYDEFLSGPRLDSLFAAYSMIEAMINLKNDTEKFKSIKDIVVTGIFDNEEIGSKTYVGADSEFMLSVLSAIMDATGHTSHADLGVTLRRSFLLSGDMAHSIHPNYSNMPQDNHQPKLNGGIVLKYNCNGRFCTDSISGATAKYISNKYNIPLTEYIIRQDSPCGSTLGNLLASKLGCMSADIGICQLGMHSCRETAGVLDFYYYSQFVLGFLQTDLKEMVPKDL